DGATFAAERTHEGRGEQHGRGGTRGRRKAERQDRIAGEGAPRLEEPGEQRREVDVAERRMRAAREVVELVAEVAVAGAGREVRDEYDRRQRPGHSAATAISAAR